MRKLLVIVSSLGFATPSVAELTIPQGLSVAQAVETMALTGALAAGYASACSSDGIQVLPEYAKPNAQRDADFLVELGYDRNEVYSAHNELSQNELASKAVLYMLSKGVDLSSTKSICVSAAKEIEEGSAVGKRLFAAQ